MNLNCVHLYLVLLTVIIAFEQINCQVYRALIASEIVKSRGFRVEEHNLEVSKKNVLNLVRIVNPKISSPIKHPVVFIHGVLASTTCYLINSKRAEPSDWTSVNVTDDTISKLEQLLVGEPAAKSLPFLLSNLGHDVWLLNRRATIDSQRVSPPGKKSIGPIERSGIRANSSTNEDDDDLKGVGRIRSLFEKFMEKSINSVEFDPEYWDFTGDDQVDVDIPKVIDYVLETSKAPKLSIVAHSFGGGLSLMLLISKPEYAHKLTKTLLLGPHLHQEATRMQNPIFRFLSLSTPILARYKGPVLPGVLEEITQAVLGEACDIGFVRGTICTLFLDLLQGEGTNQYEDIPEIFPNTFDMSGSKELSQDFEAIRGGFMRKFNYENPIKNQLVYGQLIPPRYNASRIISKDLAIWYGNTDKLVPPESGDFVVNELTVPVDRRTIGGNDIKVNYLGFFYHKNVTILVNIPAVKFINS